MSNYDKAFALGDPPNYRPGPAFFLVARSDRLSVSVAEPAYKLPAGRQPKALLLNPRRTSPTAISKQCALRNDLRLKLPDHDARVPDARPGQWLHAAGVGSEPPDAGCGWLRSHHRNGPVTYRNRVTT